MLFQAEGKFLKEKREQQGLTQGDVQKRLGFGNPQFISNWERGLSGVPPKHIQKVSDIYCFDPEVLIKIKTEEYREGLRAFLKRKKK
jgi:transcriptional regulator with XRE-family HTH domain